MKFLCFLKGAPSKPAGVNALTFGREAGKRKFKQACAIDFPDIKAANLLYIHKRRILYVIYFTAFFCRKIVAIMGRAKGDILRCWETVRKR